MSAVEAGVIAVLTRERDEALRERDEQRERADLLAEKLHGSYGAEQRWWMACKKAEAEREDARQAAGFILDDQAAYGTSNRDHWEEMYSWLKKTDD